MKSRYSQLLNEIRVPMERLQMIADGGLNGGAIDAAELSSALVSLRDTIQTRLLRDAIELLDETMMHDYEHERRGGGR